MNSKTIISFLLAISLNGCGFLSDNGPSSDYVVGGLVGTAAGAGIGAAVGSAISNGDIASSALLGAGVGLAVGVVGTYAYKKIKVHNEIIDNDESIESNRQNLLARQAELESLRADVLQDSQGVEIDESKTGKVYDGATLGVYYR